MTTPPSSSTSHVRPVTRTAPAALALATVLVQAAVTHAASTSFPEPATVFYGRITGTAADRPFPVTRGTLTWTLRRANGTDLTLRARVRRLGETDIAYRLAVPHEALGSGLATGPATVALKATGETHRHLRITVDDVPAQIADPAGTTFDTAQALRAATYRLDLEVPLAAADADGDGIPDWWEDLHRLSDSDDPDTDGDGRSNHEEYLAGSDPNRDERTPTLVTGEISAYAGATTGVYLKVFDADSPPTAVVFTLIEPPQGAELRLRNTQASVVQPDTVLGGGAMFTQADVQQGRLVVVVPPDGSGVTPFTVALRDRPDGPVSAPHTVAVRTYRPATTLLASLTPTLRLDLAEGGTGSAALGAAELPTLRRYLQGTDLGLVIWDLADDVSGVHLASPSSGMEAMEFVTRFGPDRPQTMSGGSGPDRLQGGLAGDVLAGGPGDDVLTGGEGGDRFVFAASDAGTDVVTDFQPEHGDRLDLRRFLEGASGDLRDHLTVVPDGDGSVLRLRRQDAQAPTLSVRLAGLTADRVLLRQWLDEGRLLAGALGLPPAVSWRAAHARASENGPAEARLLVQRSGATQEPLEIELGFGGTAVSGEDYAAIPARLVFAAGEATAEVVVRPYADSQSEPAEIVEVTLREASGYQVEGPALARVTVADLLPVLTIEALEPVAVLQPQTPGTFVLRRAELLDRSVLVRLDIGGSATGGEDYASLSRFVNLAPGQATALVAVTPLAGAVLAGGAETLEIRILPDDAYLVGAPPVAQVTLVEKLSRFASWRSTHFPGSPGNLEAFAAADSGGTGVTHLLRYALGMDPLRPDRARLPRIAIREGYLTVDLWQRPSATDVEILAEVSGEVGSRDASAPVSLERIYPADRSGEPGYLCLRSTRPVAGTPRQFVNIRLRLRP